jgi:hypothetical protein
VVWNLKDTKAELGHLDAVVERNSRHDVGHTGRSSVLLWWTRGTWRGSPVWIPLLP